MSTSAIEFPRRSGPVAVIDIGSNSVRLVIFTGAERNAQTLFNEKVLAGLGRSVATTGQLDSIAMERALAGLKRFRAIMDGAGVAEIQAVATAAVREAKNGADFVAEAAKLCGANIRVLSGEEEAYYAADGVFSAVPDADGLVGDLGGGSLELVEISGAERGRTATLPLGPLKVMDQAGGNMEQARVIVNEKISELDWLTKNKGRTLYAVGGVWRALARLNMVHTHYPLNVLNGYVIPKRQAMELASVVGNQSAVSLAAVPGIAQRRVESIPYGALVLEALMRATDTRRVVISTYGLREGILFGRLTAEEQARDPLFAACEDMAARLGRFPDHGRTIFDWSAPLFIGDDPARDRLRRAACLVWDIGWRFHPDYRGEQAMNELLHAPLPGIDHGGRVCIALALYHRYEGAATPPALESLGRLVSEDEVRWARILGQSLRLAPAVFGATPALLKDCALKLTKSRVRLGIPAAQEALTGETLAKRLDQLAASLGRKSRIKVV